MSNDYRNEVRKVYKEGRWTFFKIFPIFLLVIVLFSSIGFVMNAMGLFGKTVVERVVFENSFQRSESLKSEIATNEAVITEIESQLANPTLDESTRANLNAQLRAARVRISTARGKQ